MNTETQRRLPGITNTPTTVYATKAFSPIYRAITIGFFAYTPMRRVPKTADNIVATIDGPKGIPAA
jgi:hypothetical protein